jgi:hypothetical protein
MGLTQKLGLLAQSVQQDASLNIGIGGAANASYKLQVTGTTNVTGVLTLGSTISNGTFTYTLPSATGTLALTSALSGYLPLTGGTLTGALSGTSATFTSGLINGTTDAFFDINRSASGNAGRVRFQTAGTDEFEIGLKGGVAGFHITKGDATELLTIASSGAATFSSSVSAATNFISVALTDSISVGTSVAENAKYNYLGHSGYWGLKTTTTGFNFALDTYNGGTPKNVLTITQGGNVGIGTATPTSNLEIYNNSLSGILRLSRDAGGQRGAVEFGRNNGGSFQTCGSIIVDSDGASVNNGVMYFYTSNSSGVNTERMRIGSDGNIGMGRDNASDVRLFIKSAGNTSASHNLYLRNSDNTDLFRVRNDSAIFFKDNYPFTTASGANLWIDSSGVIQRNVSSIKYKNDVQDYDKGLTELMKLRPVSYLSKSEIDNPKRYAGMIAEELHELGFSEYVNLDNNGEPDSISYASMVALLTKAIQEQQAQIEELKALINK